jgi:phosphoribosylformylglycinamidine (FGAM) synthase-like enzyme
MKQKNKGQSVVYTVLALGATALVAIFGSMAAGSRQTATLVDTKFQTVQVDNTQTKERIAVLEANLASLKEDVKEIKGDVKSLLKVLK